MGDFTVNDQGLDNGGSAKPEKKPKTPLPPEEENHFNYEGVTYPAKMLCELLHTREAKAIATYEEDFYAGMPVLTENAFGKGKAYYVATDSNDLFYEKYLHTICKEIGIEPVLVTPRNVEAVSRKNSKGEYVFLLNHSGKDEMVEIPFDVENILTGDRWNHSDGIKILKNDALILKKVGSH